MPTIFDNISSRLIDALVETLRVSQRADFCVGYFNLRGWKQLAESVDGWDGSEQKRCRVLVGMHVRPEDEIRSLFSAATQSSASLIDLASAARMRRAAAQEFQRQLVIGVPTDADETALRKLSSQLRSGKAQVKLYLSHPLHAKLYLCFRDDFHTPIVAFLGSSNLTFSGLIAQGELNVNVVEQDACEKLQQWFIDRWNDRLSVDISEELAAIIDSSWAREETLPPFYIYAKIAYHLCQEARAGLSEFRLPPEISTILLEHQITAVKIAARYLLRRGGVLLGDVVGLGKTVIASAIARMLQDDPNHATETLIICNKTLVEMWERYVHDFRLLGKVLPISQVIRDLPRLRRYRLVIIDESQVLRNREGKRYRVIRDYIKANESRCLLLSATPYNKTLLDLSSQLRLFLDEDQDLGVRPERIIRETGELEFMKRLQGSPRSLLAFEKSPHPDDWHELMGLFMVRRTRSFVEKNYARRDPTSGRSYLPFGDGRKFYFPKRIPKTLTLSVKGNDRSDVYSRLQSPTVVNVITNLKLPRYGLGNYVRRGAELKATAADLSVIKGLSRAGKRLIGFCRTSFFKRLESEAHSFLLSVERHVIRNYLFLHAIHHGLTVPIGAHGIDTSILESDPEDYADLDLDLALDEGTARLDPVLEDAALLTHERAQELALRLYQQLAGKKTASQKWVDTGLFTAQLKADLEADANALLALLADVGRFDPQTDTKLAMLDTLVNRTHRNDKVLVFTQYADTARYVERQLLSRGTDRISCVTGDTEDPVAIINRFSPHSNLSPELSGSERELRVLVATDLLSEGQNLQDCAIVVNFDLPWAIVRLIQRAGRVDRIGQESTEILCYTFLPSEGVENIIRLRRRLRERLRENAEVVGTDEQFFDEREAHVILNVYAEKLGSLDDEDDEDGSIDLASQALQLWRKAIKESPDVEKIIPTLPNVVYSVKASEAANKVGTGAIVFTRSSEGVDSLAFVQDSGDVVTESPFEILRLAACKPDTPFKPKPRGYHDLVRKGVEAATREEGKRAGALGRPSSARFRTYEILRRYLDSARDTLFATDELDRAAERIHRSPLRQSATDTLNRMLRAESGDDAIAEAVLQLHREDRLTVPEGDEQPMEMELICSLGLTESR